MRGLPLVLHLGPFAFHLYGIGLCLAGLVSYDYARRRLRHAGLPVDLFARVAGATVLAGLVGARLVHVLTNWSLYASRPLEVWALWHGGLASFGGLALGLPVFLVLARHAWPDHSLLEVSDVLVPAVVAGWSLGRFLGPQFMLAGGGHPTTQWFGLAYHGQVGRRVPVPLIQGLEDGLLWAGLVTRTSWTSRQPGRVTGMALLVWGLVRTFDEHFLLGQDSHTGSLGVQVAGLLCAASGVALLRRRP